jgi:hypothetical protein
MSGVLVSLGDSNRKDIPLKYPNEIFPGASHLKRGNKTPSGTMSLSNNITF